MVGDEQTLVLLVMSPGWLSVYIIFITKCWAVSVPWLLPPTPGTCVTVFN